MRPVPDAHRPRGSPPKDRVRNGLCHRPRSLWGKAEKGYVYNLIMHIIHTFIYKYAHMCRYIYIYIHICIIYIYIHIYHVYIYIMLNYSPTFSGFLSVICPTTLLSFLFVYRMLPRPCFTKKLATWKYRPRCSPKPCTRTMSPFRSCAAQ